MIIESEFFSPSSTIYQNKK